MNLADLPWHPMGSVPKDGSVFVVVGHEWNVSDRPLIVQLAQFFNDKRIIAPGRPSRSPVADGWLTLAEFDKLVNGEDAGI